MRNDAQSRIPPDRPPDSAALSAIGRDALIRLLEVDAASEYDARHLYDHLAPRMATFSDRTRAFLATWRADEERHYRGLRALLSWVAGVPEAEIDGRMADRAPAFDGIAEFIADEVALLATFAYDERVTVQAYAVDYPIYDRLGPGPGDWVRRTNRDEARHYRNALSLLKGLSDGDRARACEIVDGVLAHDLARGDYRATFLLDHGEADPYFTDERLRKCAAIVQRHLSTD